MKDDEGALSIPLLEAEQRAQKAEQRAHQAENDLAEKHAQLMRVVDVLRYAQTTVTNCIDLLDRRASTPEYNRERSHTMLLLLSREIDGVGMLS
jgi:hypothetical protein